MRKSLLSNPFLWSILILSALVPYAASINGDFVYSDIPLVKEDPFYRESHPFTDCWRRDYWNESMAQGLYRPFTVFSYWVNAKTTGIYSPGFRAVNLALHAITVLIVFYLALSLGLGRAGALISGVLFAIHPLHTEAVIPAFGRSEILCSLFVLAGLLMHVHTGKNRLYSVGTALCLLLACWSKEHGIALLPLCVLYDFYSGRLKLKEIFRRKEALLYLVYLPALAVVVISRLRFMGSVFPTMANFDPFFDNQLALCGYPLRALSAINIQGLALLKFVWPQTLSHDYSFAQLLPLKSVFDPAGLAGAALVISLPFIIVFLFPELKRKIFFFTLAYIVCVLPAANIITPTGTIFAERLYYLPSVWLGFAAACVLLRISRKMSQRVFFALLAVAVCALCMRTYLRSADWRDQHSIALAGTKTSPMSAKTWNNLAVEFAHAGDFKGAVNACNRAISIHPSYKMALLNRAFYSIKLGDFDAAEKDLRKLISLGTLQPEVYNKLGAILANKGNSREALEFWGISLKLNPRQTLIQNAVKDLQAEIAGSEKKDK